MDNPQRTAFRILVTSDDVELFTFDDIAAVTGKLYELMEQEAKKPLKSKVYLFEGNRLLLTKGNPKSLVLANGDRLSILPPIQPEADLDLSGNLVDPDSPAEDIAAAAIAAAKKKKQKWEAESDTPTWDTDIDDIP